jgi:hypothetical protein
MKACTACLSPQDYRGDTAAGAPLQVKENSQIFDISMNRAPRAID